MQTSRHEVEEYVRQFAPELDPGDVYAFMDEHAKPDGEPDSHVQWATRLLRSRGEGEHGGGPAIDRVADEMRRRDG